MYTQTYFRNWIDINISNSNPSLQDFSYLSAFHHYYVPSTVRIIAPNNIDTFIYLLSFGIYLKQLQNCFTPNSTKNQIS